METVMTTEKFNKLPVFVKEYIHALERKNNQLRYERDCLVETQNPTKIVVDWDVMSKIQHYLPSKSRILFLTRGQFPGSYFEISFDSEFSEKLKIRASGRLSLQFEASNVLSLNVEK